MCESRGQRIVSIKSQAENEFIWRWIVKPTGSTIWLGATNIVGTKNFTWQADGSDVNTKYTNWSGTNPSNDGRKRNAIAIDSYNGIWYDFSVSNTKYVICERINIMPLQYQLTEHTDQSDAKFAQLDEQLKAIIKSVQEMKQSNEAAQRDLNDTLTRLLELNAINGQLATNHTEAIFDTKNKVDWLQSNLTSSQQQQSERFSAKFSQVDQQWDQVNAKFNQVDQRFQDFANNNEQLHTNVDSRLTKFKATADQKLAVDDQRFKDFTKNANDNLERRLATFQSALAIHNKLKNLERTLKISLSSDFNGKINANDRRLGHLQVALVTVINKLCDIDSNVTAASGDNYYQRRADCLKLIDDQITKAIAIATAAG